MEIIRCSNGHFYDSTENRTCPYCEKARSGGSGMLIGTDFAKEGGNKKTAGASGNQNGGYMPTEAFYEDFEIPTTPGNSNSGYPVTTPSGKSESIPYTVPEAVPYTVPAGQKSGYAEEIDWFSTRNQITRVVGWLVCIEGPTKGKDYRIVSNNNFIGRNRNMEISIPEDLTISADKSAVIAYDVRSKGFYFGLVAGHNMVSINDRVVFNPEKIQAFDILGIGDSRFVFVPLCGDKFEWDD